MPVQRTAQLTMLDSLAALESIEATPVFGRT